MERFFGSKYLAQAFSIVGLVLLCMNEVLVWASDEGPVKIGGIFILHPSTEMAESDFKLFPGWVFVNNNASQGYSNRRLNVLKNLPHLVGDNNFRGTQRDKKISFFALADYPSCYPGYSETSAEIWRYGKRRTRRFHAGYNFCDNSWGLPEISYPASHAGCIGVFDPFLMTSEFGIEVVGFNTRYQEVRTFSGKSGFGRVCTDFGGISCFFGKSQTVAHISSLTAINDNLRDSNGNQTAVENYLKKVEPPHGITWRWRLSFLLGCICLGGWGIWLGVDRLIDDGSRWRDWILLLCGFFVVELGFITLWLGFFWVRPLLNFASYP
jgi:hypothetical protein